MASNRKRGPARSVGSPIYDQPESMLAVVALAIPQVWPEWLTQRRFDALREPVRHPGCPSARLICWRLGNARWASVLEQAAASGGVLAPPRRTAREPARNGRIRRRRRFTEDDCLIALIACTDWLVASGEEPEVTVAGYRDFLRSEVGSEHPYYRSHQLHGGFGRLVRPAAARRAARDTIRSAGAEPLLRWVRRDPDETLVFQQRRIARPDSEMTAMLAALESCGAVADYTLPRLDLPLRLSAVGEWVADHLID